MHVVQRLWDFFEHYAPARVHANMEAYVRIGEEFLEKHYRDSGFEEVITGAGMGIMNWAWACVRTWQRRSHALTASVSDD